MPKQNFPAPTEFLEVHWLDIVSCAEWCDPGDLHELKKMVTRGWKLCDTEERLIVCASFELSEDQISLVAVGDTVTIPWGVITEVYCIT